MLVSDTIVTVGIRPDPFNMNLFATFSDFPGMYVYLFRYRIVYYYIANTIKYGKINTHICSGDAIKIWDIRKASNTANKSNTSAVFTINPKTSLNVAEVGTINMTILSHFYTNAIICI